ncbi:MAG: ECF transporter S component [Clostridiales bacterium]|nr:ECF transporter S component [Clostridiales bacterium]
MKDQSIKKLVTAALFAALTCIATMVIKIPTPTFGYIHLGDCFVLLSGFVLGPCAGGLAAGIGSMFADLFSGYASFAPATLVIKAATAALAGLLFRKISHAFSSHKSNLPAFLFSGIIGEALMVIGYFLYETAIAVFGSGGLTPAALAAGITTSTLGIPFNIVQGVVGVLLAAILFPALKKINL